MAQTAFKSGQAEAQARRAALQQEEQARREGNRILTSGNTQAINDYLKQQNLNSLAQAGAPGAAEALAAYQKAQGLKSMNAGAVPAGTNPFQAALAAQGAANTKPATMQQYTAYGTPAAGFQGNMSAEDQAVWKRIGDKFAAGDPSWVTDTNLFRGKGNWSSYTDRDGRPSGWLYAANGIGGYAPVFGGKVGETGYAPGTVFYAPDGSAYTMAQDGTLSLSGNVTWVKPGQTVGGLSGPEQAAQMQAQQDKAVADALARGTLTREQLALGEALKGLGEDFEPYEYPEEPNMPVAAGDEAGPGAQPEEPTKTRDGGTGTGETTPEATPETAGAPYDFGEAPEYGGSEYENLRDEALRNARDAEWSYDPNQDTVWQAYMKQYRREGQRAAQDALGRYAALTGGVPGSYAMTAASQAGDYYAAQLSDKLPQVYNNAYQRYLQEFQRQLGLADEYNQLAEQDYGRFTDRLAQYNLDRSFRYGLNRDAVEDARYEDETAYNRAWAEDQRKYERWMDELDLAYREKQFAQQLLEYADQQKWKAKEWEQYLREYGDQMSETEKKWAYQVERDRLDREERADETAYQRALTENEMAYERDQDARNAAISDENTAYKRRIEEQDRNDERRREALSDFAQLRFADSWIADILDIPEGTSWEQYMSRYGGTGEGDGGSKSSDTTGEGDGGSKDGSDTTAPPSGSVQYDASGKRTGTWQDSDGYTYVGYHPDGQWKSKGYDGAWTEIQSLAKSGATKEQVLTRIKTFVNQDRITDYEAEMMLVNLGYRTKSAGIGTSYIGPNNVQMVQ